MRRIGTSELFVSPLCLGGNTFGWTTTQDEAFDVLDKYVGAGGNFIDTADVYSEWKPGNRGGESESILGEWMKIRGNRNSLVIATKVGKLSTRPGLSTQNIQLAVHDSLKRLGIDTIDLYYAHEDDLSTPLEETLEAFDHLVTSGQVRYIAASNFSQDRLSAALSLSKAHGWASYVGLQPQFNLLEQDKFPLAYREFCASNGIGVLPYYGIARGFLSGKYRPSIIVESARAAGVEKYANARGWQTLALLDEFAGVHNTSIAAVALAWIRAQISIVAPISSARIAAQLDDLLPTPELSDQELADLTKVGA